MKRAKEVWIQKVIGARKGSLINNCNGKLPGHKKCVGQPGKKYADGISFTALYD